MGSEQILLRFPLSRQIEPKIFGVEPESYRSYIFIYSIWYVSFYLYKMQCHNKSWYYCYSVLTAVDLEYGTVKHLRRVPVADWVSLSFAIDDSSHSLRPVLAGPAETSKCLHQMFC